MAPIHRLNDIYNEVISTFHPSQLRGMVHFKSDQDKIRNIKNASFSFLEMDGELCCYFTCKRHLEDIFACCDRLIIPPSSISTITFFDVGYFIH